MLVFYRFIGKNYLYVLILHLSFYALSYKKICDLNFNHVNVNVDYHRSCHEMDQCLCIQTIFEEKDSLIGFNLSRHFSTQDHDLAFYTCSSSTELL
mgnify:CR=1 FL=1